jgi:hypothetical protein
VHQFAQELHHSSVVISEASTAVNSDQDVVGAFRSDDRCGFVFAADACAFSHFSFWIADVFNFCPSSSCFHSKRDDVHQGVISLDVAESSLSCGN